jgi:lipoate-protein ligase A
VSWTEHHEVGAAATFHDLDLDPGSGRSLWWFEVDRPTLVLGSTQPDTVLDTAAVERAGVAVARRRSGGGAVHLEPGGAWWVDVVIPRGDPLWDDDVSRAFLWLGDAWARALTDVGLPGTVHRGGLEATRWSRLVCFAGLGPGEVTAPGPDARPRKVVGISQRRTRTHARFQCVVHRSFDPWATVGLLALPDADAHELATSLAAGVATVPAPVDSLRAALLAALP